MKIAGFVKNSFVDYPKYISAVIFTNGCNLSCFYCHNKKLISGDAESNLTEDDVLNFLKQRKNFLDGVVITGGEPTLQHDLTEFICKVKKIGYKVKLDTNGTNFDVVKFLIDNKLVDYVAMDYKAPLEKMCNIVGNCDVSQIRKTRDLLLCGKVDYEFRTTFCPRLTEFDIEQIANEINGAKSYYIQRCNLEENQTFGDIPNKKMAEIACKKAKKLVNLSNLRGFD